MPQPWKQCRSWTRKEGFLSSETHACNCCYCQVFYHCPTKNLEPSKGGRRELSSFVAYVQDLWCSTTLGIEEPRWDFDRSCDLPRGWTCAHVALYQTISDKGSHQLLCWLLPHRNGLKLTFAGSQSDLLVERLRWPNTQRKWWFANPCLKDFPSSLLVTVTELGNCYIVLDLEYNWLGFRNGIFVAKHCSIFTREAAILIRNGLGMFA